MKIRNLAQGGARRAKSLHKLLSDRLRRPGGYQQLMKLIYNTTGGINGFDKFGHFLRANLR